MSNSTNLILPLLEAAQAQKHVTVNESLQKLDALVHLAVDSAAVTDPPASPPDGTRYLIPSGATGVWAGRESQIAAWQDGAWSYFSPRTGWRLYDAAAGELLIYDGSLWSSGWSAGAGTAAPAEDFLINGAMTIDQWNNGASVDISGGSAYVLDRWRLFARPNAAIRAEKTTASLPPGQEAALKLTVLTNPASLDAADFNFLMQNIEGGRLAPLEFGTAGAKDAVISFWVRSSQSGTFAVSLRNRTFDRCYVGSYSVNAPDTWELKEVAIPAEVTGNWPVDNLASARVTFDLGSGANFRDSGGSWATSNVVALNSQTDFVLSAGATLFLAGVRLEAGSARSATPERPRPLEEKLCQRYFCRRGIDMRGSAAVAITARLDWPVAMRAAPALALNAAAISANVTGGPTFSNITDRGAVLSLTVNALADARYEQASVDANAEL